MSLARAIPIPSSPHKSFWKKEDNLGSSGSSSRSLPVPIMNRGAISVKPIQTQIDQQTWTEWKGFSKQLDELTNWLSDVVKQVDSWKTPSDDVFSLRVQLEKHLAFALQIETHQQEKERVISCSKLFSKFAPLQPYLNETIKYTEIQWKGLKKQLGQQHKQIEEALTVAEMCISNGSLDIFEGDSLTYEQTQDVLDQIGLRLRSQRSTFKFNNDDDTLEDADTQQVDKAFGSGDTSGLMDSGYGSSPDFEVLYEELNEWLEEMQGVVTDNNNATDRNQHISKSYDSELQIHNITKSFLEDQAVNMKTSQSTSNVDDKISDVNTKWQMLERRISCNTGQDNDVENGQIQEEHVVEKETSLVEIEEMILKLKGWLTETECKLFAPESRKCLGHVTHLERRRDLHKAIQEEISNHSKSIDTVLSLCDALQDGNGATEKKKESLQLAAINLERRWDAVQSQSINLQCALDEKLRVFKGVFNAKITTDPLYEDNNCLGKSDVDDESTAASILITPTKFYGRPYRPTASQDDAAMYRSSQLNYDDILMIREAFSENDAFSISDVSDILEDDFEFDDVLPLKRSVMSQELLSNDGDLDISDLGTCPSKSSLILTIPKRSPPDEPTSDIEFWSVSPKDEDMADRPEKNKVQPKIIKANPTEYVSDFDVVDEYDYMTDASQDSFNNVFILPLFNPEDDCDLDDEEILSMISDFEADMENAIEDIQVDHVIAEIKEVFPIEAETTVVERPSYKMSCFTYTEHSSPNSNNNNNNDDDEEEEESSSDDEAEVIKVNPTVFTNGEQDDAEFDLCSSNAGTKWDACLDRSKSACSGYESLESKSFLCSEENPAAINNHLTVSLEASHGIQAFVCPVYNPLLIKSRKVSDMRRRFSSSSNSKHDDLMEISDISLVHMVESVDHATLLANSICDFGRITSNSNYTNVVGDADEEQSEGENTEATSNKKDLALVATKEEESELTDKENKDDDDMDSVCTTNTSELLEALEDVMDELAELGNEPVEDLNLEPLITDVYPCTILDLRNKDCGNSSTYSQTDSMDSGVFTGTELSVHESTILPCVEEIMYETEVTELTDEMSVQQDEDAFCENQDDDIYKNVNKENADEEQQDESYKCKEMNGSRRLVQRVVRYALPIQILLSVYMILLLVIPAIIETSGWECSLSINNRALFESLSLDPILKYIRGPPPV